VQQLSDIHKPVNKSEVIFIASVAIYYSNSQYRKSMDCHVGCWPPRSDVVGDGVVKITKPSPVSFIPSRHRERSVAIQCPRLKDSGAATVYFLLMVGGLPRQASPSSQ